ncbi:DMT family transporter [Megasphaera sp.]|uniref:DMT family transporter n=1 Tax=Megasphaera sp. TaxID=2023260 RepID=UPI003520C54F
MTQRSADLLLLTVIAARGTSYLLAKIGLGGIPPLELLAVRFFLTTLILCLIFHKRLGQMTKGLLKAAAGLGAFLFACMACEIISLTMIASSTAAFLENTSSLWVLLLAAIACRRWPQKHIIAAAVLLIIGIALLTLHGSRLNLAPGELICLAGSVFYAFWILFTARLARQHDPLLLGIVQMGFLALYSAVSTAVFETPLVPTDGTTWGAILALVFICSVFGFTFQPVAQKYTTAEKAGLFTAFNPLIASCLGFLFLGETFSTAQLAGAAAIIVGLVLAAKKGTAA